MEEGEPLDLIRKAVDFATIYVVNKRNQRDYYPKKVNSIFYEDYEREKVIQSSNPEVL